MLDAIRPLYPAVQAQVNRDRPIGILHARRAHRLGLLFRHRLQR